MTFDPANRLNPIKPSATLAINSKAKALMAEGKQVINMGVGEPDFDTPDFIKKAGIEAIECNCTRYAPVDGLPEFKQAIADKFARENQLSYELDQIIVGVGAKQVEYNACQALLNPGDEVIIPAPYWVSYPAMVELTGAKPVIVHADSQQHFKITPDQLEQAITDKTKLFILNSPSNPTGMIYSINELKALAEVLLKFPHVWVLCDDMYEHIAWNNIPFQNIVNAEPKLYKRTLVVNGVSKAYAMTGWRIGYAGGPAEWIKAIKKIQSHSTSGACTISQKAATAALNGPQQEVKDNCSEFRQRQRYMVDALNELPWMDVLPTDGTFYLFPNISNALKHFKLKDDAAFATMLLEDTNVAVVPGSAFGDPECVRMSIAVSMQDLETVIQRFKALG